MSTLDDWTSALCTELGIDQALMRQKTLLDLARVAAHSVDRPAAPLTTYLLGIAVGQGQPLEATAARIEQLASGWQPAG
jgi:hypothetical protein